MPLAAGTKLGPYEVLSAAGAGGMGEVYRARDTRLERTVAIKVLPSHLSSDPDLKQRFEREARAISSLQHPHICTLHDVGSQDGVDFLVMEYLEGETLALRLERGPLPLEQVLRYGMQVADALEKAHRQGVLHRDLKPGNVMLTKSGSKLLDFGLAKPAAVESAVGATLAFAPTAPSPVSPTTPITQRGMVVGTYQYMSPEQIEGKETDARSDIFALGALLYEMATGKHAFEGKSRVSIASAILEKDPEPIGSTLPTAPPALEHVVRTCLAKDPEERWQSAGDVARELKWIAEAGSQAGMASVPAGRRKTRERLAWGVAALLALVLFAQMALVSRREPLPAPMVRSEVLPPEETRFYSSGDFGAPVEISPDGSKLVFGAGNRLWVRSFESGTTTALPGTEGAYFPFWSPEGKRVGYFVTGKLKTIEVTGGAPLSLADAPNARGGSWGPNDEILFTPDIRSGVYRVPAAGGTPVAVTKPEATGHTTHRWPHVLPDGEHFLYLAANHNEPRSENTGVFSASTDGKENRRVMGTLSSAVYAAGHLLFLREGTLMAQPFDPVRGSLSGEPVRVQDRVVFDNGIWRGLFSASESALVYEAGELARGSLLTWYDRSGKPLGNVGQREAYGGVELSPDGRQLAVTIDGPPRDVWIFDLDRGFKKRFTLGADKSEINALWAPDGRSLFYTGYLPDATYGIYRQPIGGGAEQLISGPHKFALARDVSPDLRSMLMDTGVMGTEDILLLSLAGDGKIRTLVGTPFWERDGQFSPDGRWVAITSRESGRDEVYVVSVSHPGKWQVSNQGGQTPRWRRDGKELFFLGIAAPYTLNVAAVNGGGETFHVGAVRSLFHANLVASPFGDVSYDVTADGQRVIATVSGETSEQVKPLSLVLNWKGLLKK